MSGHDRGRLRLGHDGGWSDPAKGHNIVIGYHAAPGLIDRNGHGEAHHNIVIGVEGWPDVTPEHTASYCIGIGPRCLEGIVDEQGVIEIGGKRFVADEASAEALYHAFRRFLDEATEGWLERLAAGGGS